MDQREQRIYRLCSENYNNRAQLIKTLEELGELSWAIAKYLLATDPSVHPDMREAHGKPVVPIEVPISVLIKNIILEVCDVEAMLKQIEYIKGIDDALSWEQAREMVTNGLWRKLEQVTGKKPEEFK